MKKQLENDLNLAERLRSGRHRRSIFVIVAYGIFIALFLFSCSGGNDNSGVETTPDIGADAPANTETSEVNTIRSLTNSLEDSEVASFQHSNQYHSQLPCTVCHNPENNSSRVSFPGRDGHTPCIGCHTQQFADTKSPICTICHTDMESGGLKRFPPLRSHGVKFNHSKHLGKTNCATCHKPSRRGVALSIPAGANAHATCFQCHSAQAGQAMSSCGLCHESGRKPGVVSESAKAFNVNFSHSKHRLNCAECHNVLAGSQRGRQVTAPVASMHFPPKNRKSCASCHNNKRAFGGDDFADCKRCHKGNSFAF